MLIFLGLSHGLVMFWFIRHCVFVLTALKLLTKAHICKVCLVKKNLFSVGGE